MLYKILRKRVISSVIGRQVSVTDIYHTIPYQAQPHIKLHFVRAFVYSLTKCTVQFSSVQLDVFFDH